MTAELALARRAEDAGAAIIDREIAAHGKGQRSERLARLHADMTHAVAVFGPCSPAHLGCLLALVREAHGDALISCVWAEISDIWRVYLCSTLDDDDSGQVWHWEGSTEGEALIAALEAAP